jgi:regulatory protein
VGEVARSAGEGSGFGRQSTASATAEELRRARVAGYALLAGRDFSVHEMTERLLRKGYDAEVVAAAVSALVQEGFLREERYAEHFVSQHAGRGRGPVRIRMQLREKGVEGEVIDRALETTETDWVAAAREARRRKFGAAPPGDYRERVRQARFLRYRGFSSEHIQAALGAFEDEDFSPDF